MKDARREVTADPGPVQGNVPCDACAQNAKKIPTPSVTLTKNRREMRARVDTSPIPNPFTKLHGEVVRLCSDCRSSTHGWGIISDPRRYGAKSCSALQSWKARVSPSLRAQHRCYICHCLEICNKTDLIPFKDAIKGPRLNLQLL